MNKAELNKAEMITEPSPDQTFFIYRRLYRLNHSYNVQQKSANATPHFDFESKKEYMKPEMEVVKIQEQCQILAGSVDANGMNTDLQDEDFNGGW